MCVMGEVCPKTIKLLEKMILLINFKPINRCKNGNLQNNQCATNQNIHFKAPKKV